MYLVSPCTHLPKNSDPSLLKSCYQKTFDDGTHSTLSPALHFQGPRPPSWYYLAVTPLSGAMGIFELRLRFVQIWVRWVKSRTKFKKYKLAQNDEISFVLFEISCFGRLQTIPQQEFLCWMWNDALFEWISLRSVRFWGRSLRASYKRRFVLKQFVNQYPEGLLFWKLPPYPIAWFGILVWYSVLSSATRCSLKSESPTRTYSCV